MILQERTSRARGIVVALLLAVVTVGCATREVVTHQPETVGVVETRTLVGRDLVFEFTDGRVFSSPANMDYVGGSQPNTDDLLLAGSIPELWVYRATPEGQSPPNRPLCFQLFGTTNEMGPQIVKTVLDPRGEFTLVFPKAPDWVDVGRSGDQLHGALTCINEAGHAFEERFASAEG